VTTRSSDRGRSARGPLARDSRAGGAQPGNRGPKPKGDFYRDRVRGYLDGTASDLSEKLRVPVQDRPLTVSAVAEYVPCSRNTLHTYGLVDLINKAKRPGTNPAPSPKPARRRRLSASFKAVLTASARSRPSGSESTTSCWISASVSSHASAIGCARADWRQEISTRCMANRCPPLLARTRSAAARPRKSGPRSERDHVAREAGGPSPVRRGLVLLTGGEHHSWRPHATVRARSVDSAQVRARRTAVDVRAKSCAGP
jgi:hypothetical protein